MAAIGDMLRSLAFSAVPGDAGRKVSGALGGQGDKSSDDEDKKKAMMRGIKKAQK